MQANRLPAMQLVRTCFALALIAVAGRAAALTYNLPPHGGRIVGQTQTITAGKKDTLVDIARRFDIGYRALVLANPGVDVWLPGAGTKILIPTQFILPDTPHHGIVVNVPEMRIYYYPKHPRAKPGKVMIFPIGIGRQDWRTPLGLTRVSMRIKGPAWYPPASIRAEHAAQGDPLPSVVPAGPDNPLGQFALRLALPGYLIHGTNKPDGIGMEVSHGCIRLYPEDIKNLFRAVPHGTRVRLVDEPYKAAWQNGKLYFSAQPLAAVDASGGHRGSMQSEQLVPEALGKLMQTLGRATFRSGYHVDWDVAERMAQVYNGLPQPAPLLAQTSLSAPASRHDTEGFTDSMLRAGSSTARATQAQPRAARSSGRAPKLAR